MMDIIRPIEFLIEPAGAADAAALARLHTESWRTAYRDILPDAFLDGPVAEGHRALWDERMHEPAPDHRVVLKAVSHGTLVGFACVLFDEEPAWGAKLDNLHVAPELKFRGIGSSLFRTARDCVAVTPSGDSMYLWVFEANVAARRFYDRRGGVVGGRQTLEIGSGIHVSELRYVWSHLKSESR